MQWVWFVLLDVQWVWFVLVAQAALGRPKAPQAGPERLRAPRPAQSLPQPRAPQDPIPRDQYITRNSPAFVFIIKNLGFETPRTLGAPQAAGFFAHPLLETSFFKKEVPRRGCATGDWGLGIGV